MSSSVTIAAFVSHRYRKFSELNLHSLQAGIVTNLFGFFISYKPALFNGFNLLVQSLKQHFSGQLSSVHCSQNFRQLNLFDFLSRWLHIANVSDFFPFLLSASFRTLLGMSVNLSLLKRFKILNKIKINMLAIFSVFFRPSLYNFLNPVFRFAQFGQVFCRNARKAITDFFVILAGKCLCGLRSRWHGQISARAEFQPGWPKTIISMYLDWRPLYLQSWPKFIRTSAYKRW